VRKIGYPAQPELAVGAVASGGIHVLNQHLVAQLGLSERDIERLIQREQAELARRESVYSSGSPPLSPQGKQVLLTDDGLATGASMRAAITALRAVNVAKLIVAVPVGAAETVHILRTLADEVVCPNTPANFSAVGEWYQDFSQTTDAEVSALLAASVVHSS
jgi:putative phosphoribosyl transferase